MNEIYILTRNEKIKWVEDYFAEDGALCEECQFQRQTIEPHGERNMECTLLTGRWATGGAGRCAHLCPALQARLDPFVNLALREPPKLHFQPSTSALWRDIALAILIALVLLFVVAFIST